MSDKRVQIQALEPRRLLSAVYPTAYEQYMVEMYNWARMNPTAAATRYGTALNEGPSAQNITADPKQPLAINPYIVDAARDYAQLIIDVDQFDHYINGTNPGGRMAAAGYNFSGAYGSGENAGLNSISMFGSETAWIDTQFQYLYVDSTIPGRWHRINMMNPDWKEMGSGHATGQYTGFNVFVTVQNFAYTAGHSFLTGVAYNDSSNNNFFTPGEQLAGVTITAIRDSDNAQFSTTTWASGGYSLALAPGTYTIWGSGGSLGGYVKYDDVTIGSQNLKRDFRPDYVNSATGPGEDDPPADPPPSFAQLNGGALTIDGTDGNDVFNLSVSGGTLSVILNDETATFSASSVTSILLNAGSGNDQVTLGAGIISSRVNGGDGNDVIQGGNGADILMGDAGDDTIYGGAGSDRIYGGVGNDSLDGQTYADRIYGGDGNDAVIGGAHNDVLYGEIGNDTLSGGNQNDYLDGGAGADYMCGGKDIDTANYSARSADLVVQLSSNYSQQTGTSGEAGESDNVLSDVENINGGSGNDRLVGSTIANVIHGYAGNDTIYGLGGADALFGEDGVDRFYSTDSTRDTINGGAGRDIAYGDLIDLLSAVEVF